MKEIKPFKLYGILNTDTGKLISNLTNPSHKYWEKKKWAEIALQRYVDDYDFWHDKLPRRYPYKKDSLKVVEVNCIIDKNIFAKAKL